MSDLLLPASTSPAWSATTLLRRYPQWTISPLIAIAILLAWMIATDRLGVPEYVLPPPGAVLLALSDGLWRAPTDPGGYWYHTGITLYEALAGLLLGATIGAFLGFALGASRILERSIYPFIIAFQALPKVALAPLLVIWFGLGFNGKIYITAIITFFPVLISALSGSHAVDPERLDLARSCNAKPLQILRKIVIPSAMPFLFTGLNVASALAMLGAIVGEFVGARAGLGMLLIQYDQSMEIAPLFAVLIILAVVGYAINHAVRIAERHYCFWSQRRTHTVLSEA